MDLSGMGESLAYVEAMYERYRTDPTEVPRAWHGVFEANGSGGSVETTARLEAGDLLRIARVFVMVNEYRVHGHLAAVVDPLAAYPRSEPPELQSQTYGFSSADAHVRVPNGDFRGVGDTLGFGDLHERLRATYCGSIGVEFMHIAEPARRNWIVDRIEPTLNRRTPDGATRRFILERLTAAGLFEQFLHKKYVGTKRFSIEGAETLLPLLDLALDSAGRRGVVESVLGMAHRGRLSVLHFLLGKTAEAVFTEFSDVDPESVMGGGDVKYHLGASHDYVTRSGSAMHLSLSPNPSHLEAVNPVVVGRVRAKQHRGRDFSGDKVMAILVHGDAAFAGQGLVAETLNLSELWGYRTGGTLHVIVNNQIGFTASPASLHSTLYATDVAKMIGVPIFHVNGEDPDAVAHVVDLAIEYRQTFHTDVVVDMFCFRRYGHNEGDDPAFTQPLLYARIAGHPAPSTVYAERLVAEGVVPRESIEAFERKTTRALEEGFARATGEGTNGERPRMPSFGGYWTGYQGGGEPDGEPDTGVPRQRLQDIARVLSQAPSGFHVHRTVQRLLDARADMGAGKRSVDWAMAELLALGSLALDGATVRMSGQDTRRGTFSQRHAVLVDQKNGAEYMPLQFLAPGQGGVMIYDSLLSEAAALGFELGYSLDYPEALVAWEAQFGDFVNGAQVIIDQFLATSEDKWNRISGLTLLLPHGFEGQGPEHSSARLERWLQLGGQSNIQVTVPSTPAQYFHVLRRQVLRPWRKPLVILTPKSLLRGGACVSRLEDLASGRFQRIVPDPNAPEHPDTVVLCSGKLYYDLAAAREDRRSTRHALIRVEQLYPLREEQLSAALDPYGQAEVVWAQEEPINMGAWTHLCEMLRKVARPRRLRVVARAESASPATGSYRAHQIEQKSLIDEVFAGGSGP